MKNNFNINVHLNDKINLDDITKSIVIEDEDRQLFMHKTCLSGTIEILEDASRIYPLNNVRFSVCMEKINVRKYYICVITMRGI